jgi:vanillate O-demethylase ferredoxin subunit
MLSFGKSDDRVWLDARIIEKQLIAEDIMHFILESASNQPLPPFTPGSHIDVELSDQAVRQYSLCNDPNKPGRYEIAVKYERDGRGGSRCAHQHLQRSDVIRIGPPRNAFSLTPASHTILIAGGIGITPIVSMAEHLSASEASFELHYCTRSPHVSAFLPQLRDSAYAHRVRFYHGDCGERFDIRRALAAQPSDTHLYVCGPKGFMQSVIDSAVSLGWDAARIHYEYFSAPAPEEVQGQGFEVVVASTGLVVAVAEDQTIAGALAAQGVHVPVSCEQGICGTCTVGVLDGTPDHRDCVLSDAERGANRFTPCCSRAKSARLVLDL